ncbi:MAG: hypothetical protein FWG16_07555 [Micrococcales bacterium]|nr:hypothetical protein [Micrococcales bacterium]
MTNDSTGHSRQPNPVLVVMVGLPLVVALIMLAFLWPAKTSHPHNLPVSVVGPPPAVEAFSMAMERNSVDMLTVVPAADRAQAVQQIKSRQTYGAIILAQLPDLPEVLTSPAASPAAAGVLDNLAKLLQAQAVEGAAATGLDPGQIRVNVTPIVPLTMADPTGSGLAAASFPLVICGIFGGMAISLLVNGAFRRLYTLLGYSLGAGLAVALVLGSWFGFLPGNFGVNLLVVALSALATASFIVGMASMLGLPGLAIAAAFTFFVANPMSSAAAPWQFMAEPWGAIGQALPPGAANWLIRSVNYFPHDSATKQWLVLGIWAAVGLSLVGLSHLRRGVVGSPIPALGRT